MKRLKDERSGKLEPMKVSEVKDGGPVKLKNKISRDEYLQDYNHFGRIGRIKDLMDSDEIEYEENIFKETNTLERKDIDMNIQERSQTVSGSKRKSACKSQNKSSKTFNIVTQRNRSSSRNQSQRSGAKIAPKTSKFKIKWMDQRGPYDDLPNKSITV